MYPEILQMLKFANKDENTTVTTMLKGIKKNMFMMNGKIRDLSRKR